MHPFTAQRYGAAALMALKPALGLAVRPRLAIPSSLSSHEPEGGSLEKLGSDTARPGYGRFEAPRARTEYHASSRGAGESFITRPPEGCALVLWAICESARATRKKIISPFEDSRLSLLERFNKKGPEDCESFSA